MPSQSPETSEVGRDSMLHPGGQEQHGGQVGPRRVSAHVNPPGTGRSREPAWHRFPRASGQHQGVPVCPQLHKPGGQLSCIQGAESTALSPSTVCRKGTLQEYPLVARIPLLQKRNAPGHLVYHLVQGACTVSVGWVRLRTALCPLQSPPAFKPARPPSSPLGAMS